jgi:CRISPR-associated endonuclease Cas2
MRINKGSLSYWILIALEGTVEILEAFSYSGQMKSLLGIPQAKDASLAESIRRLRKRGLIEEERNREGKIILRLTELGKAFLGKEGEWDSKYRIVVWDIPESKRKIRNLLRRRLKGWGFVLWQRSVWVSKSNVTDKLRELIRDLGIEEWVAVIESEDELFHKILNDRLK